MPLMQVMLLQLKPMHFPRNHSVVTQLFRIAYENNISAVTTGE